MVVCNQFISYQFFFLLCDLVIDILHSLAVFIEDIHLDTAQTQFTYIIYTRILWNNSYLDPFKTIL
jgi:hypothetical protein